MKKYIFNFIVVQFLFFIVCSTVYAQSLTAINYDQPQIDVELWVRYADTDSVELHFGFDQLATHCLDPMFYEVPAPPPGPVGIFDARLNDPRGYDEFCLADGVYRDFRYLDIAMTDTFELDLLPASGTSHSPYALSWSAGLSQLMQSCQLKDMNDNLIADMLATQAVSIPYNSRMVILFIYALPISSLPAIPRLVLPSNGSTYQPLMPTLRWTTSFGASQYQLQVSTNLNFTTTVFDDSTVTDTSKQIGPLTAYTTYYWRVRGKNTVGLSAWSNAWNFTTINVHYKPQIDVQMWVRYADADPLELHFGFDQLATRCLDYVFDEWWLACPPSGIFDVRFIDPRGYDEFCLAEGVARDFRYLNPAMTDTFELDMVPACCTPQSPYVLSWSAGLSQFLQSCQMKDINDNLIADMLTTQAVSIPYRRFVDLFIYALPKSSLPAIPKLVSPSNGSMNQPLMLTLRWTTSFSASQYRLQVSTNSNFTTMVFDDSTVTDTSKQIGPLTENTKYYWRVRAKNPMGISAWSNVWNLTTTNVYVQPQIDVQLWVRYADTDSQELHFGFDQLATRCMDAMFNEVEAPPTPPTGIFDVRFTDPRGYDEFCMGNGVLRDFRYLERAMTDTFELDLVPASSSRSPYALSWPAGLSQLLRSCQMKDINDDLKADMLTTQTVTIPYSSRLVILFIYAIPEVDDVKHESNVIPSEFALNQNYPNPFNPSTMLQYGIPSRSYVKLEIINTLGSDRGDSGQLRTGSWLLCS